VDQLGSFGRRDLLALGLKSIADGGYSFVLFLYRDVEQLGGFALGTFFALS
jgi:hypothetical protein